MRKYPVLFKHVMCYSEYLKKNIFTVYQRLFDYKSLRATRKMKITTCFHSPACHVGDSVKFSGLNHFELEKYIL